MNNKLMTGISTKDTAQQTTTAKSPETWANEPQTVPSDVVFGLHRCKKHDFKNKSYCI